MTSNYQKNQQMEAIFESFNKGFPQIRSDGSYSSGLPMLDAHMYDEIRKGIKKRLLYYTMVNTFIESSPSRKKNQDLLFTVMDLFPGLSIIPRLHRLIITSQLNPKKLDSTWKEEMIEGSMGIIGGNTFGEIWKKTSGFLLSKIKNLKLQKKINTIGEYLSEETGEKAGESLSKQKYRSQKDDKSKLKDNKSYFIDKYNSAYQSIYGLSQFPYGWKIGNFQFPSKHAIGIPRVPYDNYPALLHEGESVLTKRETRNLRSGFGSVSIAKLSDTIIVREDADIDRIANALVGKIKMTALNMA